MPPRCGLFGFSIFSQCPERPDWYGVDSRFDKPIQRACSNGGIRVVVHRDPVEPAIDQAG
jgi:hypothetical protein